MTPRELLIEHGFHNVDALLEAAEWADVPVYIAATLLDMESYRGKNIFGTDSGGMFQGQEVTRAKYEEMVAAVADGGRTNGVGPTQLTHRSFFPQAEREGFKLWIPLDNMKFGFRLLKRHYTAQGTWQKAAERYNGKSSYGVTFARRAIDWKSRLEIQEEQVDWHLAPSLKRLQKDLDAVFGEDRPNDGTIGDQAHAARESEHNPDNDADSMPRGAVSALDAYTKVGTKTWITAAEFAKLLAILKKDSRVWYVIHKGKIYSRTNGFVAKEYEGSNPHNTHIHISLMQTKAAHDDTSSWGLAGIRGGSTPTPEPPKPSTKKLPILTKGDSHDVLVPFLKRFLFADPPNQDSKFGKLTYHEVRRYQKQQGLVVDGVVGPKTWAKIAAGGTKLPEGYSL